MLAQTANDVEQALELLPGDIAFEWKMDGARIQVHRLEETIRVFTRNLNEVTSAVPEVVETIRALPVRDLILDGEAIALSPTGRPHPFQVTMRRFGRRVGVEESRAKLPLERVLLRLPPRRGADARRPAGTGAICRARRDAP